jgi:hypothetical protein
MNALWSSRLLRNIVVFVCFLACCSPDILFAQEGPLVLISREHVFRDQWRSPYVCRLYSLDEQARGLTQIWSDSIPCSNIRLFESSGVLLITVGYNGAEQFQVYSTQRLALISTIDATSSNALVLAHYYSTANQSGQLELIYSNGGPSGNPSITTKRISTERDAAVNSVAEIEDQGELRLGGVRAPYGGGEEDLVRIENIRASPVTAWDLDQELEGFPVPDSVIVMKESRGWSLIANESNFRALLSTPHQNGLTQREILLFDRNSQSWSSILIPGNETCPCLINGYLAGVIEDGDPRTDWSPENKSKLPPAQREESVILDIFQKRAQVVHLGKDSEIIWIEAGSVYYRVGNKLYSSTLAENGLANVEMIIQDEQVRDVHWAFRSVGSSNK